MPQPHLALRFRAILRRMTPFVLFAILIWMTHFWGSRGFGLYEDDHSRIPEAMEMTGGSLWAHTPATLLEFEHGRPLHPLAISVFTALGFRFGGLEGIYLVGYLIVVANAFLFYLLLKRLSSRPEMALLGGLAFCLFPADTTQAFLTHALGLQPALTMLLVAFHLYLSGRIKSSYAVIFCALFTYETVFPVFAVAPLLPNPWNMKQKSKLLRHLLVLGTMLVFVAVLRRITGEARVAAFGPLEFALLATNLLTGPLTSLAMFVYRPIETLIRLDANSITIVLLAFFASTVVLWPWRLDDHDDQRGGGETGRLAAALLAELLQGSGRLLLVGALMLILAYPLTLTTLGFAISGRGTRAHLAAVVGASTVLACLASAILRVAAARGKRHLATLALAAWLALLVGFGLTVQRDYRMAWSFQRSFWTDLVRLCPDVKDGTVILVDPGGLPDNRQFLFLRKQLEGVPDPRQIKFLTNESDTLQQIYSFPQSWSNPPTVYRLPIDRRDHVRADGGMLVIDEHLAREAPISIRTVATADIILLETNNGRLSRSSGSILLGGRNVTLKPGCVACENRFSRRPLYAYLIRRNEGVSGKYPY